MSWLLALSGALLLTVLVVRVLPFLSLASLDANQRELSTFGATHPVGTAAIFVALYIVFAALPLPGAEILTIAAGALFGLVEGTMLVSFASSIGATLAFLMSRLWLGNMVQRRFSTRANVVAWDRRRGRLLSLCVAADPDHSVLPDQSADGTDEVASLNVRLGEPDRHASSDRCLRECRSAACAGPLDIRYHCCPVKT